MLTVEDFFEAYPKYESLNVEEEQIERLIALAQNFTSSTWGETKQAQGIELLVAHWIEAEWLQQIDISGRSSAIALGQGAGNLTSIENDFTTTAYGRRYLELKKTIPVFGMTF